jgi:hypothetical protein
VFEFLDNDPIDEIDMLGKCTLSPTNFNWTNPEHLVVRTGRTVGDGNRADTRFSVTSVDCACSCPKPGKWTLSCVVKLSIPAVITIDPANNPAAGQFEGMLGHEQLHVANVLRFANDLKVTVGLCEQLPFATPTDCQTAKETLYRKAATLSSRFNSVEGQHGNFRHPMSGQDYSPSYFVGPIQGRLRPQPPQNPGLPIGDPFNPDRETGYLKPTVENVCPL